MQNDVNHHAGHKPTSHLMPGRNHTHPRYQRRVAEPVRAVAALRKGRAGALRVGAGVRLGRHIKACSTGRRPMGAYSQPFLWVLESNRPIAHITRARVAIKIRAIVKLGGMN
jgi:hypothetical protein